MNQRPDFRYLNDSIDLMSCARSKPQAALMLMERNCGWQPEVFQLSANWEGGNPLQAPKKLLFDKPVSDDIIVQSCVYEVERPNYATDALDKAEMDYYNALRPGIKIRAYVEGGLGPADQYGVATYGRNIQSMMSHCQKEGPLNSWLPSGYCLEYSQQLVLEAYLTRTLQDGENPYILTVTVNAIRLGCRNFNNVTTAEAMRILKAKYSFDLEAPARPLPVGR